MESCVVIVWMCSYQLCAPALTLSSTVLHANLPPHAPSLSHGCLLCCMHQPPTLTQPPSHHLLGSSHPWYVNFIFLLKMELLFDNCCGNCWCTVALWCMTFHLNYSAETRLQTSNETLLSSQTLCFIFSEIRLRKLVDEREKMIEQVRRWCCCW